MKAHSMGTLFVLAAFLGTTVQAQTQPDYEALLKTSVARFDAVDMEQWAFIQTTDDGKKIRVESYDPRREETQRWQLVSIDAKAPGSKALKRYAKRKKKDREAAAKARAKRETGDNDGQAVAFNLKDMITPGSLVAETTVGHLVTLQFKPRLKNMGDDATKALAGTLVLDMATGALQKMTVFNTDELSPAFSVSIDRLNMDFEFAEVDGSLLPRVMRVNMHGKFAFFKTIQQTSTQRWSDYAFVGAVTAAASGTPQAPNTPQ